MTAHRPEPTKAEVEILQLLWTEGPQTVRQVHEVIERRRGVGYTTVLKLLQNMTDKGLVTREES
jgi:BlaI family transcriptional regulator, penicillinase repressor